MNNINMDYRLIPLRQDPSPQDPRDWHIGALTQILVSHLEEFELPYNHPIKNQGFTRSCVSISFTYCREIGEEIQTGKYVELSPCFCYVNRGETDHRGTGMYPQEGLEQLRKYGICNNTIFPIIKEYPEIIEDFNLVAKEAIKDAEKRKITAYARCYTVDDIKSALVNLKNPVTIEIPIYDSFYKIDKNYSVLPIPDIKNETFHGYHEMTITGWNKNNMFHTLNSYGVEWGESGYCWIPYEFLPYILCMYSMTDNILPSMLTITSSKNTCAVAKVFYIKGHTSIPNQIVKGVFNRPSGEEYRQSMTSDTKGDFMFGFAESAIGEFKAKIIWECPDGEVKEESVLVEITE